MLYQSNYSSVLFGFPHQAFVNLYTYYISRTAFVDLEDASELDAALALSGGDISGNSITVEKAKPRGVKEPQNKSFTGGDSGDDSKFLFLH